MAPTYKIISHQMSNVINGGWRKAEILPYKCAIATYGASMAGLPSQIAYGGWQEKRHAMPWWRHGHYLTTLNEP